MASHWSPHHCLSSGPILLVLQMSWPRSLPINVRTSGTTCHQVSSEVGLLGFFLLALGNSSDNFLPAWVSSRILDPSTCPMSLQSLGSTRVGVEVVGEVTIFLLCWGGQLLNLLSSKSLTDRTGFLLHTQIFTTSFSLQQAHFKWSSTTAIIWSQVPLFCTGDDIIFTEYSRIKSL